MNNNVLTEIFKVSLPITKQEQYSLKWHNSVVSVRTEQGLYLLEFTHNFRCYFKTLDFKQQLIPNPKSSAVKNFIPHNFLKRLRSNLEISETVLDPQYWSANPDIIQEMSNVYDYKWSPNDLMKDDYGILAVLTNIGNVELFSRFNRSWASVVDVSQIITEIYNSKNKLETPCNYKTLKIVTGILETSAICWGPEQNDKLCMFVTAQKNGTILFWHVSNKKSKVLVEYYSEIECCFEIFAMTWVVRSENNFVLICTSVFGEVFALNCNLQEDSVRVLNTVTLWEHRDRSVSKKVIHLTVDSKTIVFYDKYRHLIVHVLDDTCHILNQQIINVNDFRISDICHNNGLVYLSTINGKLYEVNFDINNNELKVILEPVEIRDLAATYEICGVGISRNNAIVAVLTRNRQIHHKKKITNVDIIFYTPHKVNELSILLQNPMKTLCNYWDCIELVRFKTRKTKLIPEMDYISLYKEGENDVYKLKLYLIFLTFNNILEKELRFNNKNELPEKSEEKVKETILALHSGRVLDELSGIFKKSGKFPDQSHQDSYAYARNYLQFFCKKYDRNENEFVTKEVLNLSDLATSFICQYCEEILEGVVCKNGHANMFCCLTFTLIESDDYLICVSCDTTARIELLNKNARCPFCDLLMIRI